MVEVELSDLKKLSKDISEQLSQRLKSDVTVKGHVLIVPDDVKGHRIGVKDVKLHMKHVLHNLGLSEDYRVLAEHQRIRIVKVEERRHYAQEKGTAPPPAKSLPYFFPG